jgi:hypothetical protein
MSTCEKFFMKNRYYSRIVKTDSIIELVVLSKEMFLKYFNLFVDTDFKKNSNEK